MRSFGLTASSPLLGYQKVDDCQAVDVTSDEVLTIHRIFAADDQCWYTLKPIHAPERVRLQDLAAHAERIHDLVELFSVYAARLPEDRREHVRVLRIEAFQVDRFEN